jgi:two-component system response regulator AtoC
MDFERVGGIENINVNVRIISTTNSDILKEVREGRFRADLYYRLAGLKLVIPPLRNRKEDIPQLVWFFINQFAQEAKRRINSIDPATFEIFDKYHWPGNIRQLSNVVRSALILGSGETLSLSGMSSLIDELQSHRPTEDFDYIQLANETLEELEQKAILATLGRTEGNKAKAAKALGISDRTLRDKIKRYRQEERLQMTG